MDEEKTYLGVQHNLHFLDGPEFMEDLMQLAFGGEQAQTEDSDYTVRVRPLLVNGTLNKLGEKPIRRLN
jgi:hypothetical protein